MRNIINKINSGLKAAFVAACILCSLTAAAQQQTVTGKVTDTAGAPVMGATVVVKSTSRGTSTNNKGEFSIQAQRGDVLEVKFLGMKTQEVKIDSKTHYTVKLEMAASEIAAVVINTEYGKQRKIDVKSAVDSIVGEEIVGY